MNTKSKMFVATVLLSSTLIMGATSANASWFGDSESSLVDRIVSAFKLNKTEVDKVVTDFRFEKQKTNQAQALVRLEEKLTELVADGKITDAQKKLIISKHKELQAKKVADQSKFVEMNREEKQAYMEAHKTELESWAKANGIDAKYVLGFGGGMGRGGMMGGGEGRGGMRGWK